MIQLEFFPKTHLKTLSDFQHLETVPLSLDEKKSLINYPTFFHSPKSHDLIRKQHSDHVDRILGLRPRYIEEMLEAEARGFEPEGSRDTWGPAIHGGAQTWVGLDLQVLQTPYSECLRILNLLKVKPYQHIVDLGAAYGRMGIVVGGLFLKSQFTGFEYVKARVDEGARVYKELGLVKCQLLTQDLSLPSFTLPDADIFFIYDYGQVEHIERTLKQIEEIALKRPVKIVARGKYTKQIIAEKFPSFQLKYEGKMEELFSIYTAFIKESSASPSQNLSL